MKRTPPPSTGLTVGQLEDRFLGTENVCAYRARIVSDWEVIGWFITPYWYEPTGVVRYLCRDDKGRIGEAWAATAIEDDPQKMLVGFGKHFYEIDLYRVPPGKEPFVSRLLGDCYDFNPR